jgi:hypothetical protein
VNGYEPLGLSVSDAAAGAEAFMSEIQEIDVFLKPDGTVKVEVRGAKGEKCLALTEDLEKLLGGSIVERIYTDEFSQVKQDQEQEDLSRQR